MLNGALKMQAFKKSTRNTSMKNIVVPDKSCTITAGHRNAVVALKASWVTDSNYKCVFKGFSK